MFETLMAITGSLGPEGAECLASQIIEMAGELCIVSSLGGGLRSGLKLVFVASPWSSSDGGGCDYVIKYARNEECERDAECLFVLR
jgi:hypothetical protein